MLAADGTTLVLEDTYSLHTYYGVLVGDKGYAAARSVIVDVLNKGLILDAQILMYTINMGIQRRIRYIIIL